MDNKILFPMMLLMIFITSCTSQPKPLTLDDARQVAVDAVMRADAYSQYEPYDFKELSAGSIWCDKCFEFSYSFLVNDSSIPDVRGYDAYVFINESRVQKLLFTQLDNCTVYAPEQCPANGCIVCPPCPECSSIKCQKASVCEGLGFDAAWYNFSVLQAAAGTQCTQPIEDNTTAAIGNTPETTIAPLIDRFHGDTTCENFCGDGLCEDQVCQDPGCICEENKINCPEDCGK